jgi:hypothetical protein
MQRVVFTTFLPVNSLHTSTIYSMQMPLSSLHVQWPQARGRTTQISVACRTRHSLLPFSAAWHGAPPANITPAPCKVRFAKVAISQLKIASFDRVRVGQVFDMDLQHQAACTNSNCRYKYLKPLPRARFSIFLSLPSYRHSSPASFRHGGGAHHQHHAHHAHSGGGGGGGGHAQHIHVHVQAGHQNPYFAAPPKPTDPSGLTYTPPSELHNQTLPRAVTRSTCP